MATWNILTLNGTGYQVALVRELKRYKIAIAGLTEARLSGSGEHDVEDGHLLYSGGTEKRNGVAFELRPPFSKALTMWHPLSDRLLYARLAYKHGPISIIVAYALTNEATDSDKDRFYDELSATTQTVPPHDELLVIGDLNAVSGEARIGFETAVGPYGSGSMNDNSERLLSFCASFGLAITGSWFKRLDIHRDTWISNDGRTRKELDHILVRNRSLVKSYRVYRGAEAPANTDHRLLVASVAVSPRFAHRAAREQKYDV